jgi:hypothetical protein
MEYDSEYLIEIASLEPQLWQREHSIGEGSFGRVHKG